MKWMTSHRKVGFILSRLLKDLGVMWLFVVLEDVDQILEFYVLTPSMAWNWSSSLGLFVSYLHFKSITEILVLDVSQWSVISGGLFLFGSSNKYFMRIFSSMQCFFLCHLSTFWTYVIRYGCFTQFIIILRSCLLISYGCNRSWFL